MTYLEFLDLGFVFSIASEERSSLVEEALRSLASSGAFLLDLFFLFFLVSLIQLLVHLMEFLCQLTLSLLLDESQLANLQIQFPLPTIEQALPRPDLLQVFDEAQVVVPIGDDVTLRLLLDLRGVASQNLYGLVHVLQLSIELLNGLGVLSLLVEDLIGVVFHVVLVDVHQVLDALVVVLVLISLMDCIHKLIDQLLLLSGFVLL